LVNFLEYQNINVIKIIAFYGKDYQVFPEKKRMKEGAFAGMTQIAEFKLYEHIKLNPVMQNRDMLLPIYRAV
jgi:hypothetical protein